MGEVHRLRLPAALPARGGMPRLAEPQPLRLPGDGEAALVGHLVAALCGAAVGYAVAHLPGAATSVCDTLLRVLGW